MSLGQVRPPAGIPWTTVRVWLIAGAVVLATVAALGGTTLLVNALRGGDRTVSASIGDRREAQFDLLSGATSVSVRGGDLGADLYRVTTPPGGDAVPKVVDRDGRVQLHLVQTGRKGASAVDIQLNSRVRWYIRLSGGAVEEIVDMGAGGLTGIDFVAGATRIELRLPQIEGTVPVRMSSGAREFVVSTPVGVPVRVRLNAGAGAVSIDGATQQGIAAGTVLSSMGWDQTQNRYDIDSAGVATLTVDYR